MFGIKIIKIADNEKALLFKNKSFLKVLEPSRHVFVDLFWNLSVQVYDVTVAKFEHRLARFLVKTYNRSITVKLIDGRLQNLDVSGQEILTRDRVSLRINLSGNYQVADAEKAATSVADYKDFLYKELQLELREAVGTRSLDELLADKDSISKVIADNIRGKMAGYGLKVVSVGVKDIILPGEMKQILNQVVEAQKQAEANLIKRREETAATRSLHNTAKVMENNPTLMRLKELEALEKIAGKINTISVYNGLEGVMNGLVRIPKASYEINNQRVTDVSLHIKHFFFRNYKYKCRSGSNHYIASLMGNNRAQYYPRRKVFEVPVGAMTGMPVAVGDMAVTREVEAGVVVVVMIAVVVTVPVTVVLPSVIIAPIAATVVMAAAVVQREKIPVVRVITGTVVISIVLPMIVPMTVPIVVAMIAPVLIAAIVTALMPVTVPPPVVPDVLLDDPRICKLFRFGGRSRGGAEHQYHTQRGHQHQMESFHRHTPSSDRPEVFQVPASVMTAN